MSDRVAEPNSPTDEDACPQTTAFDERLQHRLTDQLLQVVTGRAILHAFEEHFANAEPVTKQGVQSHPAGGQIATVLADAQHDPVLSMQPVEDFSLDQRDLAGAWIGRAGGVEAEPGKVPIASQAHPGYGLNLGQRLHGGAGAERDVDRLDLSHLDLSHNGRSIANPSFTL